MASGMEREEQYLLNNDVEDLDRADNVKVEDEDDDDEVEVEDIDGFDADMINSSDFNHKDDEDQYKQVGINYQLKKEDLDEIDEEIERYYRQKGKNKLDIEELRGTMKEPSLVICWFIIGLVTLYVLFLGFQGPPPAPGRDEL